MLGYVTDEMRAAMEGGHGGPPEPNSGSETKRRPGAAMEGGHGGPPELVRGFDDLPEPVQPQWRGGMVAPRRSRLICYLDPAKRGRNGGGHGGPPESSLAASACSAVSSRNGGGAWWPPGEDGR